MEQSLEQYRDSGPLSVHDMKVQIQTIQHMLQEVMKKNVHYGVIPGCGDKPTLLKAGAEKISLTFRLAPSYTVVERNLEREHREYRVSCVLTHIPSQQVFGEGLGICTTMEGKYRFRNASKKCPACGGEFIIKGKAEYGGGWLCFAKKGGCGAKYLDGDSTIEDQPAGTIENDNPADVYNTVLKMAKKRAHVDAVLTATAASDCFTQDIEDMPETITGAKGFKEEPEPPIDTSQAGVDDIPLDSSVITAKDVTKFWTKAKKNKWPEPAVRSLLAEFGCESVKNIKKDDFKTIIGKIEKLDLSQQ